MVDNYSRKIEAQEDTIRALNQRLAHQGNLSSVEPDYDGMIKRENEGLKQENQLMRERIEELSRQLEVGVQSGPDALDAECRRLRAEL